MKYINKYANLYDYDLSLPAAYLEMFIYTNLALFVPLFIGHPQFLVGTTVNAALITAALNLKFNKLLPVIVAPSLGVLSRGLIFGPFTFFLLYLVPFVWIGNTILVLTFKKLNLKENKNYWLTLGIGSTLKTAFLFASAFLLFKLNLVPQIFLTTMGITQFTTAVLGGVLAYTIHKGKKYLVN